MKRSLSCIRKITSMIVLAAIIMISVTGCGKKETTVNTGSKEFTFIVVDRDANETEFNITSQKSTVGEALIDEKLIEGTDGEYGLYVTKVNGVEAIYEDDGTYWSFYINGEYAMTGVDTTEIEDGATYMFKVEGENL